MLIICFLTILMAPKVKWVAKDVGAKVIVIQWMITLSQASVEALAK